MPREREAWELCEANTFSGIHTWFLDADRDATGRPLKDGAKVARCHRCSSRPNYPHEAEVVEQLLADQRAMSIRRHARVPVIPRSGRR